jgi:general secretion pathway protein C
MKDDKKIFALALTALLTLSAYFLADTVDAVIGRSLDAAPLFTTPLEQARPGIEPRRELSDYNSILERGLFGDGKGPSVGAAASEPSAFVLVGTVEGESFAGAVLQDAANVQTFYRRNEKLPDGSRIIKVLRDKITIKREGGGTFELQVVDDTRIVNVSKPGMPAPGGVRKVSEGKWMVDQQAVAASTENLNQMLTQARALPYTEQGKTVGFRISEIVPGSLYERIGLQNGDVIQRINSKDVDDPGKFFQLYQGLKEEKSISIDLMRGGQRQTLNYEIR